LDYDKKVLGAAQDAIKSFEINTANEEFSKSSRYDATRIF